MLDIATWTNMTVRRVPIPQRKTSDARAIVEMVTTVVRRMLGRVKVSSDARAIVARTSGVRSRTVTAALKRPLGFSRL
jgi:hypothetical protein